MMRVAGPIIAILAFAATASAEEPSRPAPAIQLLTVPNPVSDPIAVGNRQAKLGLDRELLTLPGVFAVEHPDSPIRYTWDPVECRLVFCQRGAELIQVAEGPGPAAPTVGAYGAPKFFGYRITEGGVPEFLYMHGRIGVEEQIRPAADGQQLIHRFRIENADFGLALAIPARWKDRIKSSAGSWSGGTLKISKDQAKAGFTLTYDLSKPPELPEIAKSWTPVSEDTQVGPPRPAAVAEPAEFRVQAAPEFVIQPIEAPAGKVFGSVGFFDGDRLAVASREGEILLSQPADENGQLNWSSFSPLRLPYLQIRDARDLPESIAVSHAYGNARLFDTDGDGIADFFKAIDSGSNPGAEPLTLFTEPDWDHFELTLDSLDDDPSFSALRLAALGLNPEPPPDAASTPMATIWIPDSICSEPGSPLVLGTLGDPGAFGAQIILPDSMPEDEKAWRIVRVLLDRSGETLQGAVVSSTLASEATGKLGKLVAAGDGEALWGLPEIGGVMAKITCNREEPGFMVQAIHLAPDAFEFTFSQPLDRKIATSLENLRVRSAAPGRSSSALSHRVETAIIDSDGMTLSLRVGGIAPGRLMKFDLAKIRSESGDALSHGPVFYSVNAVPGFPLPGSDPGQAGNSTASSGASSEPGKSDSSSARTESSRASKEAPESP